MAALTTSERYPRVFLEALAYHEAGHAVMAVLLNVPVSRVVIGPSCTDPDFNGQVILDLPEGANGLPCFVMALLDVASEPAEKMAPSYEQFASMHKVHRHLKPLKIGTRNDITKGFMAVAPVYFILSYAESTAKQRFKSEYRDLADALINTKAIAVHRLARRLEHELELDGPEVTAIVRRAGPARRSAAGRRLEAALAELRSDRPWLPRALELLRHDDSLCLR